jgi:dTDP-4-amino-4,6-dideoxygalactose transaminase
MIKSPYSIVKQFEEEIAAYTGAPYAVSVDSCTNALFLCLKFIQGGIDLEDECVIIPSKTYLSVPMSIIHSGYIPIFDKRISWSGEYRLEPYPIWDSAKRLTSGMYRKEQFQCLSFHAKKHLAIGKGGMILTDDHYAVEWFKKARYEGRSEKFYKKDQIDMLGWNMYMTPEQAARGLVLLQQLPLENPDIPEVGGGYRDLTEFNVFKKYRVIE